MTNCRQTLITFIRWSARLAVLVALLAVCAGGLYLYRVRRNADEVVRIAYDLSLSGRPPTIQDLRQRLGSALRQPDPCAPDGCGYDVLVSNRALAEMGLLPYSALRSYFWVTNGVVRVNSLEFFSLSNRGTGFLATVTVNYCESCGSFEISPWEGSNYLHATGSVEVGYAASTGNKRKAMALDTGCLVRLGGCSNIADLFPGLWWETPDGKIRCRLPSNAGVVDMMPHQH